MVAKIRDLNANKVFKITKLNMRGKTKEWFNKLNLVLVDWE